MYRRAQMHCLVRAGRIAIAPSISEPMLPDSPRFACAAPKAAAAFGKVVLRGGTVPTNRSAHQRREGARQRYRADLLRANAYPGNVCTPTLVMPPSLLLATQAMLSMPCT